MSPRYTTAAGSAYATIPGADDDGYLQVDGQTRAPTPPTGVPDHPAPAALPACDVLEDPVAHSYEAMALHAPGGRHPDAGEASGYTPVTDTAAGDATSMAAADDGVDDLEVDGQTRAPTPRAGVPGHLAPAALPAYDVLEDPAAHSYEAMVLHAPGDRRPGAGEASGYTPVTDTAAGDATDAAAADSAYIVLRDGKKMYGGVGDDTAA